MIEIAPSLCAAWRLFRLAAAHLVAFVVPPFALAAAISATILINLANVPLT